MGPSRVRDGDINPYYAVLLEDLLQWGRRVFATETSSGFTSEITACRLQWGRRVFATETPPGFTRVIGMMRRLQWGRRVFATETGRQKERR